MQIVSTIIQRIFHQILQEIFRQIHQARAIAAELRRARIERAVDYREMAVVTRSGRGLAEIARACAQAGCR